ncbi:MAG: hypothetical protein KAS23_05670 [Anaerohalosphaera sp.]|nr:hypothetical protein [Anaerohalosphaera sp.]
MNEKDSKDAVDKLLNKALGTNNAKPDFEKFCSANVDAVNVLKQNAKRKRNFFEEYFSFPNILSQLLRPVRIPVGLCLIVVLLVILSLWDIDMPGSSVAWAQIRRTAQTVDKVKFYEFCFKEDNTVEYTRGSYALGKVEMINPDGTTSIDDGRKRLVMAQDGSVINEINTEFSNLTCVENKHNFFEVLTKGILEYQQEQIDRQKPSQIADDFLTYDFSPPPALEVHFDSIVVTVGKNSLLPIQMKLLYKDTPGRYDVFFFEYSDNSQDKQ